MKQMIVIAMLMVGLPLAAEAKKAPVEKKWGLFSRGLRLGFGQSNVKGRGPVEYEPGFAFQAAVFSSFGWRKRVQLQPELSFLARATQARDEVLLGGISTGLYRDNRWELSEGQGAFLLKLGKPWTSKKGGRWLLYGLAGPAWAYHFEGKRVIRLDLPGSIPKKDEWQMDEEIHPLWIAAIGTELLRAAGHGISVEARFEQRDRGLGTGLGDRIRLNVYSLQLGLLF